MMNYKVRVENEAESKDVQGLFFELGYGFDGGKNKEVQFFEYVNHFYFFTYQDKDLTVSSDNSRFSLSDHKELAIPQLRDKVVLHRNDVGDANREMSSGSKIFVSSDDICYEFVCDKWLMFTSGSINVDLKPIGKEEMKEYLNPLKNGGYELIIPTIIGCADRDWIEVPKGANFYCDRYFWKQLNSLQYWNGYNWQDNDITLFNHSKTFNCNIVWQRNPPVDVEVKTEEPPVISDTIEETLKERQGQYGDFKFVANTTGQLMAVALNSANGKTLPYMHEEALHMIFSKIARLVNGDPNYIENWHDISGYATLVAKELANTEGATNSKVIRLKVIDGEMKEV